MPVPRGGNKGFPRIRAHSRRISSLRHDAFTGSKHLPWLHRWQRDSRSAARAVPMGIFMSAKTEVESEGFDHSVPRAEPCGPGPDLLLAVPGKKRGRPPKMSAQELLDRIRRLAVSRAGLFRVHERNASLYARARRNFGSWSAAVAAAGLDYREALSGARTRSARMRSVRMRRRRSARALRRRAFFGALSDV